MDTSETYIKMCNHPKIQVHKPKGGNTMSCCVGAFIHISKYGDYWTLRNNLTWLPRQDQTQRMAELNLHDLLIYFSTFWRSFYPNPYGKGVRDSHSIFPSMEQLWLAFYMYKKHGFIWDGKKWIKNKQG